MQRAQQAQAAAAQQQLRQPGTVRIVQGAGGAGAGAGAEAQPLTAGAGIAGLLSPSAQADRSVPASGADGERQVGVSGPLRPGMGSGMMPGPVQSGAYGIPTPAEAGVPSLFR